MSHKIFRLVSSLFLALAILGSALNTQVARAAGPWYVAPTGDDNNDCLSPGTACASINVAIGKASSGDTIYVATGTYTGTGTEVVLLDKGATLSGGWDATFTTQSDTSTIDGEGTRRGITIIGTLAVLIERFVVQNGFADYGGGIVSNFGPLTLNNSLILNNTASTSGGGIYHYWNGILNVNQTTISNNTGGGILIDGDSGSGSTATLNNSRIESNSGYGISNFGSLVINNSTINSNAGLGVYNHWHDLTTNNTTISNNTGSNDGGGLYNYIGGVVMNNTTISGNSAIDRGGGISVSSGTVFLNNSTVSGNATTSSIYGGGGIYNSGATVTLQNSILASNTTSGMGPDCHGGNSIDSSGYNLIGNTSNCSFNSGNGDLMDIDPFLGTLQDNGGPTFTHLLLSFSPAIDAGNPAGCTDQNNNLLTTDQRGIARPQGVRCDIGAFEFEGTSQPPTNDSFVDAEVINSLPYDATTNISGTGVEADEPQSCPYFMGNTVWFSFTPTETMMMRVESHGNVIGSIVGIYGSTGPSITDLQFLTCTNPGSSTTFPAEAGQTYYLQVSGISGEVGIVHVNLDQIVPTKDNFADAEQISSLPFSTTADITDATNESGEPQFCTFMERTVWYTFTPTENIAIRVDTLGGAITGNVNIYIPLGPGISDLSFLGCTISGSSFNFYAEAGTTYYLQAGSAFGEIGSIQINLQQAFPPANDNFASSEVINSVPFSITADVTDATNEPNEPQVCSFMERTVWYSFTPTENIAIRVDTLGSAVAANVNLYLASGSGVSDLTFLECSISSGSFNILAEVGKTYYLQAGSANGEVGSVQINLERIFPPPNDNFADAEAIGSLPFSATVDITDTTNEPDEPPLCTFTKSAVWYSFTPTENIAVRVDTEGSAVTGNVNLYLASGPGFGDLTFLGCSINSGSSNLYAEAGKTYYLQVGSASFGQVGSIQVNLEQIFPPANDNFADAEALVSLPLSTSVDITNATNEIGEPNECTTERTVWYAFTPTESVVIRADIQGGDISGIINVYRAAGSGISDLQFIGCASPGNLSTFLAEAGQTYYFQAGSAFGGVGSIQINLEQLPPVGNDDFANAATVDSLPFSDTRDTSTATSASDDPITCHNNGSVWYQFTPPSDTTIAANTFGSDYDTTLAVFTGSRGALDLVPGGCNDDFSGLQSFVEFDATGGITYYFMLGFCCGNGGTGGGNLILSVEETTPPSTEVTIDIKPGSQTNPINPRSSGKIPVAILSTPDFNAPLEVDRSSLTFGSTGNEHSLVSCNKKGTDVNGDGLKDLMCHFKTKLAGFKFGDTEGILKGQTLSGLAIEARDVVRVLGTSYP